MALKLTTTMMMATTVEGSFNSVAYLRDNTCPRGEKKIFDPNFGVSNCEKITIWNAFSAEEQIAAIQNACDDRAPSETKAKIWMPDFNAPDPYNPGRHEEVNCDTWLDKERPIEKKVCRDGFPVANKLATDGRANFISFVDTDCCTMRIPGEEALYGSCAEGYRVELIDDGCGLFGGILAGKDFLYSIKCTKISHLGDLWPAHYASRPNPIDRCHNQVDSTSKRLGDCQHILDTKFDHWGEDALSYDELQEENAALQIQLADVQQQENEDHAAELQTLQQDHAAELQTLQQDHAAELQTLQQDHAAELQTCEEDKAAELQTCEEDKKQLTTALHACGVAKKALTTQRDNCEGDKKALTTQRGNCEGDKKALTTQRDNGETTDVNLASQCMDEQAALQEELEKSESKLGETIATAETCNTDKAKLEKEKAKLEKERDRLKIRKDKLIKEKKALQNKLAKCKPENKERMLQAASSSETASSETASSEAASSEAASNDERRMLSSTKRRGLRGSVV